MSAGRELAIDRTWTECAKQLPPEGVPVLTVISDWKGTRNEGQLKRQGNLWFFVDGSMYVYYTPTHWMPLAALEASDAGPIQPGGNDHA